MNRELLGSVTRVFDLERIDYEIVALPRPEWETGDVVAGRVNHRPSPRVQLEAPEGRVIEPLEGEVVVGALGVRRATREIVGSWEKIPADGTLQVIGGGGVLGTVTSISPFLPEPISLDYTGHLQTVDHKLNLLDHVEPEPGADLEKPVVLVTGTSMSAGKTTAARVIVRVLKENGYDITACKLAGSARYHDVLSMGDAGADHIYDFVDAGMPTTVLPEDEYRTRLRHLLSIVQQNPDDIVVVETGASPLEPYNGEVAMEELRDRVRFTLVCASDPYSTVGLTRVCEIEADAISGIATNTEAGIELSEQLTGLPALNLHRETTTDQLQQLLLEKLPG